MIKRILGFLLAISIVSSCFTVSAAEGEKDFSGLRADYELLCALELLTLPDGTKLTPEDKLSRKYLSMIAVKLAYETYVDGADDTYGVFYDLEKSDVLYPFAKTACQSGFMSSIEGNFDPDRTVTYTELIKVLACVGGYGTLAELNGGYPEGYLYAGNVMGITKAATSSAEDGLTIEAAIPVLIKTLDTDLMEVDSYRGDIAESKVKRGNTFLKRMDITKIEGTITGTMYTNILDAGTTSGLVYIDGEGFTTSDADIHNYAGMEVTAYIKGELDIGDIIYFKGKNKHFEEMKLKGSEITSISGTKAITVKYIPEDTDFNGEKEQRIKISETAREFFNGVYNGGSELEKHINEISRDINGSMRLFDNDGDGVFDVVHLDKFESYMVSYVDTVSSKIHVKDAPFEYIDLSDDIVNNLIIIRRGELKSLSDVKADDIIQYSVSKDGKTVKIVATGVANSTEMNNNVKVEGRVVSIAKDGEVAIINVDGLTYKTTVDFWNRNKDKIIIGRNYIFYMNAEKQIAYMGADSTGEKYGFLMGIFAENEFDGPLKIKMLTADNTIEIINTVESIAYYDGGNRKKLKTIDDVYKNPSLYDSSTGRVKRQVVRYFINDWNKLSTLYTAKEDFRFLCVPATDVKDDGSMKTLASDYREEDFILRNTEVINPLTNPIYARLPGNQGGMVPVTVLAPDAKNETDSVFKLNYTNFDVGQYIADDKDFSFFKYMYNSNGKLIGLRRNSVNDTGDRYNNTPGKTLWIDKSAIIDQKYVLPSDATTFQVALELDASNNLKVDNTANESSYVAVPTMNTEHGSANVLPYMLFDIDENNKASVALLGDITTLPFGEVRYEERGIITKRLFYALNDEGDIKLKVKINRMTGSEAEFFFESDDLTDTGCMLPYYNEQGEFIGPGKVWYYGDGASRQGDFYAKTYGIYEGKPATDLKVGDIVSFKLNNKGEIKAFYTMFDGDTGRGFFEAKEGTDVSRWRMNVDEIDQANANEDGFIDTKSKYTSRGMGEDDGGIGLNSSTREFIYGKVKSKVLVGGYYCTNVETALPSWTYRDRYGTQNGVFDQFYLDDSGNTYLPIERLVDVNKGITVFVVDEKRKNVRKANINALTPGAKVVMSFPMYTWRGCVVVYEED